MSPPRLRQFRRRGTDERLALMADYSRGRFVELDFGFTPAPSGGGLWLCQQEEAHNSYAVLHGYAPRDLKAPESHKAIALITVSGVVQSIFGYPNEEASAAAGRSSTGCSPTRRAARSRSSCFPKLGPGVVQDRDHPGPDGLRHRAAGSSGAE